MTTRARPSVFAWLAALAVVMVSMNLRPGATSIGPVLNEIQADLGMSATVAGILTALPGICFAVFGTVAVWIASRLGTAGAIGLGALVIFAGLLGRSLAQGPSLFIALSVLGLSGAAICNILVPAFVKRHYPRRTAPLMTLYTVALSIGATAPGLIDSPVQLATGLGWRASIGLWSIPALVAVLPWIVFGVREHRIARRSTIRPADRESIWAMARSPQAVAMAVFFGVQSTQAYIGFGWFPQILRDAGVSATDAGLMAALFAGCGLPGGLIMPTVVAKMRDPRPLIWVFAALLVVGYFGLWLAPAAHPWLWITLLGLSGFAFPMALTLMTCRARSAATTAHLSAFSQSVGYAMAAVGPFIVGAIHQGTGGWTVPILATMTTIVPFVWSGLVASKPGFVDDELANRKHPHNLAT